MKPSTQAPVVTYEGLPLSGGGAHSLGRSSRRVVYTQVLSFLETCTTLRGQVEHSLVTREVPGLERQQEDLRALQDRFGRGRVIVLDGEEVDDAFDLLDDIAPQATMHGMSTIELDVRASFDLLDPSSKAPLDAGRWQERTGHQNHLALRLAERSTLRVELCVPLSPSAELDQLVHRLQDKLPVRLSSKHWRCWVVGRGGASLAPRRLDMSHVLA